ncbi:hypothetical protein ANCDUO_02881 [Ancylostoma duodenale]|uniref:RRM domain-containing protein n=1 Tax=Ancylostoma duodenale TaxID=51022 RepID=A0A0C2DAN1_9BILA|nr:hypothetical protein ANCDUO_02881 [Ancylostoma duodenale]
MFTKIFVGGLPYHTSDKTLHEYFEQFGDIEEAVVITDRQTQKSRGYGFVTMKDRAAAERACKDPNPIIDGRKANVNLAYLGAKPRTNVQLAVINFLELLLINRRYFSFVCKKLTLWTITFYRTLPPRAFFSVGEPGSVATADAVTSSVPDAHWRFVPARMCVWGELRAYR